MFFRDCFLGSHTHHPWRRLWREMNKRRRMGSGRRGRAIGCRTTIADLPVEQACNNTYTKSNRYMYLLFTYTVIMARLVTLKASIWQC